MIVWIAELKKLPTLVKEWVTKSFYILVRASSNCRITLITSKVKVAHSRMFLAFLPLGGREDAFGI